jgi:hypothetical protein
MSLVASPFGDETLVIQSFRMTDVPTWIAHCMDSAKRWAERYGFAYELVGDEFFDHAPEWFRAKCREHFYPVTDIARLYLMKSRLLNYRRVVWVDADVIVFDPQRFNVETESGYAFSHEVVLGIRPDGQRELSPWSINNSVIVMARGCPMLDFYIFAAEEIVKRTPLQQFSRTMIGPKFLDALSHAMPIERLTCVGLFTPEYMRLLTNDENHEALRAYRSHFGFPMAAANLCHFLRGSAAPEDVKHLDALFERGIELLLETKGELVNVGT